MIEEKEYLLRRKSFLKHLKNDSAALFFAAVPKVRSHDTNYPYRQESNFYYLSGFEEDSAALLFVKSKEGSKSYLFVHKKDPDEELWNGKRLGVKKAKKRFLVDEVFSYDTLNQELKKLLGSKRHIYYDFKLDYSKVKLIKRYAKAVESFHNGAAYIEKMRLRKSAAEIAEIRKAIKITKKAHHRAMQRAKSLSFEYELQAEFEYIFKKEGAQSDAYTTIVASGNNANTLHYISNRAKLDKETLILIDAGCEYNCYASDITRTIPASKRFSDAQRELYSLVLSVEKEIISMVRPAVLRSALQKRAEELLCEGMLALGILKGELDSLLESKAHKKYFPHGIGHWMGLDVHDQAPYKDEKGREIPLQAGMVLTVEPGIYIDKNDKSVPKKYRGIAIRIEDDILVTQDGYENLSKGIKKEIRDIESLASL
jgi:Xaa-Pro aminopeptidase